MASTTRKGKTKKQPRRKGKGSGAATEAATTPGKGSPGKIGALASGGLSLSTMLGEKPNPKKKGKQKVTEVTVDEKLPGRDAEVKRLKARRAELEARVEVFEGLAKDDSTSKIASGLIGDAAKEIESIDKRLSETGLLTDAILKAIKDKKAAEARIKEVRSVLDPILEAERRRVSREAGFPASSLKVNGKVTYVGPSRVCGLPGQNATDDEVEQCAEALKDVFGDDFTSYFKVGTQMSLDMDALELDPEFAQGLFQAIIDFCQENGKAPLDYIEERKGIFPLKDPATGNGDFLAKRVAVDEDVEKQLDEAQGLCKLTSGSIKA